MSLYNKYDKEILKNKLKKEKFSRKTVSFYRYVNINHLEVLRDELYGKLNELSVLGRIYIAGEGINAQVSVPEHNWDLFVEVLNGYKAFEKMKTRLAVEEREQPFYKLVIKIRQKIVADGLEEGTFDVTNVGKHLTAKEFNQAMQDPDTIVVDMRNHYESEVGHFKGAICPDADTFREELPKVKALLEGKKDKKVLMYCTGGIRCEKASAFLRHHGFKDVNQLYGGILNYVREVRQENLTCNFIGKNFVFDNRLGERVTEDVIATCHQCGNPCDDHTNCKNDDCHLLFIQCGECAKKFDGCCTEACQKIANLPVEEQRKLRKGKRKKNAHAVYKKGRVRPKLQEYYFKKGEGISD